MCCVKFPPKRHDGELSKAMSELGVYTSDYDINQLMRRHVEEREASL